MAPSGGHRMLADPVASRPRSSPTTAAVRMSRLLQASKSVGTRGCSTPTPSGTIYLFNYAFAVRVARWRKDPWIRLTVPGSRVSVEGTVRFINPDELDANVTELVVDRWGMWGATTAPGLLRMLRVGSHIL